MRIFFYHSVSTFRVASKFSSDGKDFFLHGEYFHKEEALYTESNETKLEEV